MSEKPMRKTQARVAGREHRRAQAQRASKLKIAIPLITVAIIAMLAIGYSVYTRVSKPARPANAGAAGPRVQVDREQIDLGKQIFDRPVRAAFNVKNAGDDTLNLAAPRIVTALQGC